MFEAQRRANRRQSAFAVLGLIYHSIVREVRKSHRSPIIGLLMNILQAAIFVLVFYVIFSMLGARGASIRGDFMIYLMTGIFLYLTHTRAMGAVLGAEGPTSEMMNHTPLNTTITVAAAALSALYMQALALSVMLLFYHVVFSPVVIDQPVQAVGMFLLAWGSGVAVGTVFVALRPWMPELVGIASTVYTRANMLASGKMFVANSLPASMLALFDWNPLFHAIDQMRGFVFLNYNPHFTSISYALKVTFALLCIGLIGEYYTRRMASRSWGAAR